MSAYSASNNHLYTELAAELRASIERGDYAIGDRIPSEPDLCTSTGYSRSTVRKALQMLVDEGYVSKAQGKGTFVLSRHGAQQDAPQDRSQFTGFTENVRELGASPSTQAVDVRMVSPTPGLAEFLETADGEQVLEICRLRMVDGSPACVETIWLPARFAELEAEPLDGSLYELLEARYGIAPGGGTKSFGICRANHRESFLLGVPLGTPLMLAEDHVLDVQGKPLHVTKTAARDDKYRYSIQLTA